MDPINVPLMLAYISHTWILWDRTVHAKKTSIFWGTSIYGKPRNEPTLVWCTLSVLFMVNECKFNTYHYLSFHGFGPGVLLDFFKLVLANEKKTSEEKRRCFLMSGVHGFLTNVRPVEPCLSTKRCQVLPLDGLL